MPNIPGTNTPWPFGWFSDPADQSQPQIDSTQAQDVVNKLKDDHRGLVGQPLQVPDKDDKGNQNKDASGKPLPPYTQYTFGDGSTILIKPDGTVGDFTSKSGAGTTGWTDFQQVRNPDQTVTYYGKDPADGKLKKVPDMPDSAAPESVKTTRTPSAQLDKLDSKGNVIAADDTTTKPVSLRDPKTGTVIDIPKDPSGSLTTINKTPYLVKPDGTATVVTGPDGKPISVNDKSTVNVPGKGLVEYDPSKSGDDAYHVVPGTEPSTNRLAKDLQPVVRNGKTYIAVDSAGGIVWQEAKDDQGNALPTETTYTVAQNDPRSPNVLLIDSQGNSKLVSKGPDWKPPPLPAAGQALTPDTTSPFVVTIGDDGKPVFTDNPNRLSINDAQKQLIQQLGIKVANGDMSEDAAQKLITSATQSMTAQAAMINAQANQQQQVAQTGGAVLQGIQQGAQTGAGILQNRVSNAQQMLGSVLGLAGQRSPSGNLGGGMLSAPAGLGEALVGGIQGWATELGGGPDVYQSAANLVQRADPGSRLGGDAANAYGVLGQMLQKYRDMTGQPHPAETIAAQQQQQGYTSPTTLTNVTPNAAIAAANRPNQYGFNPQASTAALNAAGFPDTPEGRAAAIAAGRGDLLGMPSAAQRQANQAAAAQQVAATTAQANMPFGTISNNPMLAAQQRLAAQQAGAGVGAFFSPTTVAPPVATVTV